jgi:hypothetical protein
MIFGESFQEEPPAVPPKGFKAFGGNWRVNEAGILWASGGDGPKLVSEHPEFAAGQAGVEVFLPDASAGNAGLIVKASHAGGGADNFDGYEVSLDAARQVLRLGRHRHNWEHIQDAPCEVPVGRWIPLVVEMTGPKLVVLVNGKRVIEYEDREHPLGAGTVGLRQWQREARYRRLSVKTGGTPVALPFERGSAENLEVSGMWRAIKRGSAVGRCALERDRPFTGKQSQRLAFVGGVGEIGIENKGLNRWGLHFVAGQPYEGYVWARAERPVELFAALESRDGQHVYAETPLKVRPAQAPRAPAGGARAASPATPRPPPGGATNQGGLPGATDGWQRLDFSLTPKVTDKAGRLALKLKQPGSAVLGRVFLQPGEWGRFKGLPVRRDVAEALIDQGITVLRYGGSMVNHPEYRWKKMIGPRDRRPPYAGMWYPYSSNGWGILDFLDFCEAAGFLCIPAFNLDETPSDMADFVEYANGLATGEWGRKRAADGHPAPYGLRYLELGNEERVDEDYFRKFSALAEAIWARDPGVILVVGDFLYTEPIRDPFSFKGAASGITSLSAHQKILALAKARQREVWFDVHVGTEGPGKSAELLALPTYVEALRRVSGGAKHQVVVFEFNAGNHQHRRALANALAIHAVERLGLPIATSANCLQPDGQNDNGWDQGLLFLNPSQVWLQPPGHVTRPGVTQLPAVARAQRSPQPRRAARRQRQAQPGWPDAPAASREPKRPAHPNGGSPRGLLPGEANGEGRRTIRPARRGKHGRAPEPPRAHGNRVAAWARQRRRPLHLPVLLLHDSAD